MRKDAHLMRILVTRVSSHLSGSVTVTPVTSISSLLATVTAFLTSVIKGVIPYRALKYSTQQPPILLLYHSGVAGLLFLPPSIGQVDGTSCPLTGISARIWIRVSDYQYIDIHLG